MPTGAPRRSRSAPISRADVAPVEVVETGMGELLQRRRQGRQATGPPAGKACLPSERWRRSSAPREGYRRLRLVARLRSPRPVRRSGPEPWRRRGASRGEAGRPAPSRAAAPSPSRPRRRRRSPSPPARGAGSRRSPTPGSGRWSPRARRGRSLDAADPAVPLAHQPEPSPPSPFMWGRPPRWRQPWRPSPRWHSRLCQHGKPCLGGEAVRRGDGGGRKDGGLGHGVSGKRHGE